MVTSKSLPVPRRAFELAQVTRDNGSLIMTGALADPADGAIISSETLRKENIEMLIDQ